jgi:hypothetical protein
MTGARVMDRGERFTKVSDSRRSRVEVRIFTCRKTARQGHGSEMVRLDM